MAGSLTVTIDKSIYNIVPVSDNQVDVDGVRHEINFAAVDSWSFSLILDGKTYIVESVDPPAGSRHESDGDGELSHTTHLSVRGHHFVARVDDDRSLLVRSLSAKPPSSTGIQVIRAPMPGLISRIEVEVGEQVASGKGLLVLEAMKMENEIRSPRHGRVESIHVEKGRPVEKGEPLMTITEF